MGCCVSRELGGEGRMGGDNKGGSFNSTEEETVKEVVMSETTPARPACFVTRDNLYAKQRIRVGGGGYINGRSSVNINDEVSDIGVVGGRESGEYVKWEKSKSFSGEMIGRQISGRRSPVVKSLEPSPVRRRRSDNGGSVGRVVRSGTSRGESPQKLGIGERSGRRSRSPGMRSAEMVAGSRSGTGGVGRSPSGRRTPSRGRGSAAEGSRRSEEGGGGGREGKWAQVDESLENPLVALECFIFL